MECIFNKEKLEQVLSDFYNSTGIAVALYITPLQFELERSDNISSLSVAKAYRVNGVDISTEEKMKARTEVFSLLFLLFLLVIWVWA